MKTQLEDEFIEILTDKYQLLTPHPAPDLRCELDLGCGVGSFTDQLAQLYPDAQILAADVMIGRLRKLAKRNQRLNIKNMRILRVEAGNLLYYILPDNMCDRIHFLCPDPWPKDKHRGHRLLCSNFTAQLHRVLKIGGVFHFASDDVPYFQSGTEVLAQSGLFQRDDSLIADVANLRSDFELRWLDEGKTVFHSAWRNLPAPPHRIGH